MLRYMFLLFFSVFAATAAQAATGKVFGAEQFTLENGLQVVVIPNHRVPVITQMVWYKTGAIDETPGKSGIAHFLEHLMFKGTQTMAPGEFSRRVKIMGGQDNAFTSYDYTAYYVTVSRDHLEDVMKMEADRMTGLLLPDSDVDSERNVIIEERRQRTENDPYNAFNEQMRAALFINHPYGRPVIGWKDEMEKLSRADASNWYEAHYAPNNAILVLSGDITAEEAKPMTERVFAPLRAREIKARSWPSVPPLPGLSSLSSTDPTIRQPVLTRLIRVPSYTQDAQDSLALQVLAEILDGGSATRLYRTLVAEKKIATSASLSYDDAALSDGVISISIVPADNVSRADVEKALDDLLSDLARNGVTRDEIHRAKERLKDQAVFARDSVAGPANIIGESLSVGMNLEDVEYWPILIDRVTKRQADAAAAKYLNPASYGTKPYVSGWIAPPVAPEQSGSAP